jgi:predicted metal-dependent peptidase
MSINVHEIYDDMVDHFGVDPESERFRRIFMRAMDNVIDDLESESFLTVTMSQDSIDATLDCDAKYYFVFACGVPYYMQKSGEWGRKPDESLEAKHIRNLGRAQTLYFIDNPPDVRLGDLS